jgi:hypothetical protein
MRTYYDGIRKKQNTDLKTPVALTYEMLARSAGIQLDPQFAIEFNSLWQMTDKEQSEISERDTGAVLAAVNGSIIDRATGLKELRQSGRKTGRFTNITDEMIKDAEAEAPAIPPIGSQLDLPGLTGGEAGETEKPNPMRDLDAALSRLRPANEGVRLS